MFKRASVSTFGLVSTVVHYTVAREIASAALVIRNAAVKGLDFVNTCRREGVVHFAHRLAVEWVAVAASGVSLGGRAVGVGGTLFSGRRSSANVIDAIRSSDAFDAFLASLSTGHRESLDTFALRSTNSWVSAIILVIIASISFLQPRNAHSSRCSSVTP